MIDAGGNMEMAETLARQYEIPHLGQILARQKEEFDRLSEIPDSDTLIREIHRLVNSGHRADRRIKDGLVIGDYRDIDVRIGPFIPPRPQDVMPSFTAKLDALLSSKELLQDPRLQITLPAFAQLGLFFLHPFNIGNKRTSGLLHDVMLYKITTQTGGRYDDPATYTARSHIQDISTVQHYLDFFAEEPPKSGDPILKKGVDSLIQIRKPFYPDHIGLPGGGDLSASDSVRYVKAHKMDGEVMDEYLGALGSTVAANIDAVSIDDLGTQDWLNYALLLNDKRPHFVNYAPARSTRLAEALLQSLGLGTPIVFEPTHYEQFTRFARNIFNPDREHGFRQTAPNV